MGALLDNHFALIYFNFEAERCKLAPDVGNLKQEGIDGPLLCHLIFPNDPDVLHVMCISRATKIDWTWRLAHGLCRLQIFALVPTEELLH